MTSTPSISVVLPVQGTVAAHLDDSLEARVAAYVDALGATGAVWEILLIPDGTRASAEACARSKRSCGEVQVCPPTAGWGGAVRAGVRASKGDLLCYALHWRTSAATLGQMLEFALHNPSLVIRANRRTRATALQRAGSLMFNLECRALLGVSTWDVNGTPKIFPRSFDRLLELERDDDLLDAEFSAITERCGYPVVEIPIDAVTSAESDAGASCAAALKMYLGVPRLARAIRRR